MTHSDHTTKADYEAWFEDLAVQIEEAGKGITVTNVTRQQGVLRELLKLIRQMHKDLEHRGSK